MLRNLVLSVVLVLDIAPEIESVAIKSAELTLELDSPKRLINFVTASSVVSPLRYSKDEFVSG